MVDLLLDHGAEFRTSEHYSNYSIVMALWTGNAETVAIKYRNLYLHEQRDPDLVTAIPFEIDVTE